MGSPAHQTNNLARAELFKLLADEGRLRVLALTAEDALTVSELSDLLGESQPQISKKASPLKDAGLLAARKEGTRAYLSYVDSDDAVIQAALTEGRLLTAGDGSLARVAKLVASREDAGRAFFDERAPADIDSAEAPVMFSSVFALSLLLDDKSLALDVGTGDGALLDVLCPAFDRVIAIDRSEARLAEAQARVRQRSFTNASVLAADVDDGSLVERIERLGGVSVAFAVRVLHHQAKPEEKLRAIFRLMKPGARMVIVDYAAHDDERMRDQGDVWLGFTQSELTRLLTASGFVDVSTAAVPHQVIPHDALDAHLPWIFAVAKKPLSSSTSLSSASSSTS